MFQPRIKCSLLIFRSTKVSGFRSFQLSSIQNPRFPRPPAPNDTRKWKSKMEKRFS